MPSASGGRRASHGLPVCQVHSMHQRIRVRIMLLTDESLTEPCALGPGSTFQKRSVSSPVQDMTNHPSELLSYTLMSVHAFQSAGPVEAKPSVHA
jgi:hypothetical protein